MRSAVTVSLVPEARGGPFVFWEDLPVACRVAKSLGFDAIELFAPGPDAVPAAELEKLLDDNGLALAAVGTGAGWVIHKLTLTSPDAATRRAAADFVKSMIEYGAKLGAPAIIGSMQGRWGDGLDRATALNHLAEVLPALGTFASGLRTHVLFEPINRYESNLVNRLDEGVRLIEQSGAVNVKLLADLFHMNIEEVNLAEALRGAGRHVGHVHLADSNRRPAGFGHTDFGPVVQALRDINFDGFISAEAYPYPTSLDAAKHTIAAFRRYVD